MTPTEYKEFLNKVDSELPRWTASLEKIDPSKSNVSYAVGKQIDKSRDLALKEVGWTAQYVTKERTKHTVSDELALKGFLDGVFSAMESVVQAEDAAGVTLSDLDKYAAEQGKLIGRVGNDVSARVELLEKATCP